MLKLGNMKMPKSKKKEFGHKADAEEYCPGYVDTHGMWNNGFYCPKWGPPDQKYCCGGDNTKYCCPMEDTQQEINTKLHQHVPLIIGLAVGCAILLITAIFVTCYFCRCCYVYKRRKRVQGNCTMAHIPNHPADIAVHYTACPHHYPELLNMPLDDPPPYPGHEQIEKVPLHPATCNVQTDTSGEDSPLHLPRYSQIILIQQAERAAVTSQEQPPLQQSTPTTAATATPATATTSQGPSSRNNNHTKFGMQYQMAVPRGGESPLPALQRHSAALTSAEQPPRATCTASTSSSSSSCASGANPTHACMCCHRSHVNTAHRYAPGSSNRQTCNGGSSSAVQ